VLQDSAPFTGTHSPLLFSPGPFQTQQQPQLQQSQQPASSQSSSSSTSTSLQQQHQNSRGSTPNTSSYLTSSFMYPSPPQLQFPPSPQQFTPQQSQQQSQQQASQQQSHFLGQGQFYSSAFGGSLLATPPPQTPRAHFYQQPLTQHIPINVDGLMGAGLTGGPGGSSIQSLLNNPSLPSSSI